MHQRCTVAASLLAAEEKCGCNQLSESQKRTLSYLLLPHLHHLESEFITSRGS